MNNLEMGKYRETPEFERYKYTPTSKHEEVRDWGQSQVKNGTTGIEVGDSLHTAYTLITLRKDGHGITTRFPVAQVPHLVHALLKSAGMEEEANTVMKIALERARAEEEQARARERKEKEFELSKRRNKVLNTLRDSVYGGLKPYEEFSPYSTIRKAVDRIIELEDKQGE